MLPDYYRYAGQVFLACLTLTEVQNFNTCRGSSAEHKQASRAGAASCPRGHAGVPGWEAVTVGALLHTNSSLQNPAPCALVTAGEMNQVISLSFLPFYIIGRCDFCVDEF